MYSFQALSNFLIFLAVIIGSISILAAIRIIKDKK